ncbi:HlyD family efflux transporter periplasmic adaptor subunit [Burkholderia seminalis]|uniref:HlyD family secretion protein n=1 Tax=Burkholderia seminalis TaxID=488731 RepID=UPI001CF46107|nr:HlyD family efflux transporter periplasmic adaptor subunit [Burkholderia seminalis]MCA8302708.1 HlyD family efflux transporter periplasmic adaptor subunit [Burkholderia seminalis]
MSEISTVPNAEQPEEKQPRQSNRALLFRPAALEFRQNQWLGEVVLTGSARSLTTSIVFFAIATAVVLFMIFGEYTRKEEVQGRVMIDNGAAEIFAPTVGTVIRVLVNEGDVVNVGRPLVVVSTERTIAGGNSRQQIGVELNARRSSLEGDSRHIQSIVEQNIAMLKAKAIELSAGIRHLETEITTLEARSKLAETDSARFEQLRRDDVVSQSEFEQHEQSMLMSQAQLEDLRKQRTASQVELAQVKADLRNAPLDEQNQLDSIRRQMLQVDGEIADNESNREITIPAQIAGTVTALLTRPGQSVNGSTPLMSLLPQGGSLDVKLFAPSKAVGFVKIGAPVELRYEAFPYQKFGAYAGKVTQIARTALSPSQLQTATETGDADRSENLYQITVALDSQTINAYGESIPLQDGMRVDADVVLDTRKLYEWVLEPLYTLTRRSP